MVKKDYISLLLIHPPLSNPTNEMEKLIEKEDNYEAELISSLDELRE
jgi:hypothetical protein